MFTKVDPWPQYQMLERLAKQLTVPLVMIELGPDDTEQQANHFSDLRKLCPNVTFIQLGGSIPATEDQKLLAFAASDLALSLVDNVQETFGLAVAESMAAGLPVVASDWDGYRDSVRNGVDGFLIPTSWISSAESISPGLGWLHQIGLIPYTAFAGSLSQLVRVDMDAALSAIKLLLQDKLLRQKMGAAASARARERFDREVISKKYQDLFDLLSVERRRALRDNIKPALVPRSSWRATDPVSLFNAF